MSTAPPAWRRAGTPPHTPRSAPPPHRRSELLAELIAAHGADGVIAELRRRSTPLVEPGPDGDVVTFIDIHPGPAPTLLLASGLSDPFHPSDTALRRVPDAPLQALSLTLPADWTGGYAFVRGAADVRTADGRVDRERVRALLAAASRDPLCAATIEPKPGAAPMSVGAASAAPRAPSFGTGAGRMQELDPGRPIRLYTPPGAEPITRMVVLLDGEVWAPRLPAIIDGLAIEGRRVAAVFVDAAPGDERIREYTDDSAFREWLIGAVPGAVRTVLPRLAWGDHVIVGQSMGGLCALTTALDGPDVFGAVIAQSGSFWWPSGAVEDRGATARRIRSHAGPLPARVLLEVGSLERDVAADVRAVHDALAAHGVDVDLRTRGGGHDIAWWERTLPDALCRASSTAAGPSRRSHRTLGRAD